jgi:hypothetical protein
MPPKSPKDVDVPASLSVPGMKATKLELQAIEDEDEKKLRLRKDWVGFCIKDVAPWIFAAVIVLAVGAVSLRVIMGDGFTPVEKDWARTALSAIAGGAVGVAFGTKLGK